MRVLLCDLTLIYTNVALITNVCITLTNVLFLL